MFVGIPRSGKTTKFTNIIQNIPQQPDSACRFCGSTNNVKQCGACRIRVYCCKEHQVQDWKNHKLECYQFQQHKKKDNQISGVSANQHVQSELEIAARMWKQRSNGNKELRGEEAEIVVEEVMQSIVQQTLTEHNLERVFKEEYGDQIPPPPKEFFVQQQRMICKQMVEDFWARYNDAAEIPTVTLTKLLTFLQESIPSS